MPPQDDLAQIFLPLDQISLRPLPVLLDAGLVDGELWSFVAGDGTGARGQGKCKEKEYAMIHHDYCWSRENESKAANLGDLPTAASWNNWGTKVSGPVFLD